MRILCKVCVINRTLVNQPLGINHQNRKYLNSTLALCKQPQSGSSEATFCIILFNSTHKTGIKYKVAGNISNILVRFISEGKATLQINEPAHDLCIHAEVSQLKQYLTLLKKILMNKLTPAEMKTSGVSGIGVTALNHKVVAPKKLSIQNRSEYPLKGFPRTLEVIQINDVRRMGFDRGILKLQHLRVLDLSRNLIEHLPVELNTLPCLAEINMKCNLMGKCAPRMWDWMGGKLSHSLKALNLSNNEMRYLPDQIIRLHSLVTLNIDENQLKTLPSGIGSLRNLRYLTITKNQLVSFPGSIKRLKLEQMDISSNPAMNTDAENPRDLPEHREPLAILGLRELAAQVVLQQRLPFDSTTLPLTLIKYLLMGRYCVCGKACFETFINRRHVMYLKPISIELHISLDGRPIVPVDLCFCSTRCFGTYKRRFCFS